MEVESLELENASARYDSEARLAFITYRGTLTGQVTMQVYQWIGEKAQLVGMDNIRGGVFDFRDVTTFDFGNVHTVRRESRSVRNKLDFSQTPAALLVKSLYQEQMVKVAMRVTGETPRLRIVDSMEAALAFIEDWYKNHSDE